MIIAAIAPGTQPQSVRAATIKIEPHPWSSTASGGNNRQSKTRPRLIGFPLFRLSFYRKTATNITTHNNATNPMRKNGINSVSIMENRLLFHKRVIGEKQRHHNGKHPKDNKKGAPGRIFIGAEKEKFENIGKKPQKTFPHDALTSLLPISLSQRCHMGNVNVHLRGNRPNTRPPTTSRSTSNTAQTT